MTTLQPRILSPQEYAVLRYMWDGLQYKEIAVAMELSPSTVKNYIHAIYAILGARTGIQAIRRAIELGIIKIGDAQ